MSRVKTKFVVEAVVTVEHGRFTKINKKDIAEHLRDAIALYETDICCTKNFYVPKVTIRSVDFD